MFWGNHHRVPLHRYHEEGVMILHRGKELLCSHPPKAGVEVTVRRQETMMALKPQLFLNELLRPT